MIDKNILKCTKISLKHILQLKINIIVIFYLLVICAFNIINDKLTSKIVGEMKFKYMKFYIISFTIKVLIRYFFDTYIEKESVVNSEIFFKNILENFLNLNIKDIQKESSNFETNLNNTFIHQSNLIDLLYRNVYKHVIMALGYTSIFIYNQPKFLKIFIPWIILLCIVLKLSFNKGNILWNKFKNDLIKFDDELHDLMSNLWNIKYSSIEKNIINDLYNSFKDRSKSWFNFSHHFSMYTGPIAAVFILIFYYYSVKFIITGKFDVSNRIFLLLLTQEFFWLYWEIWNSIIWAFKESKYISPLCSIWDIDYSSKNDNNLINIEKINNIKFENISFAFIKNEPIFDKINLEFKSGESIAILGKSGGGKSTLMNLLYKLYNPINGIIKIDNLNIDNISISSLRDTLTVVPQNINLFNTKNMENNIELYNKKHKKNIDNLKNLLKINNLEKNENVNNLSHGQKQRVLIARSLFNKKKSVYIFDEYLSAIDPKYSPDIHKTVIKYLKDNNKISIFILHDLELAKQCDKIYVLKNYKFNEYNSNNISLSDL